MDASKLVELIAARPLLTRKDIAARYGVSLRTVDRWHREGKLPAPTWMRGPMWKPADLEQLENSNDTGPAPADNL